MPVTNTPSLVPTTTPTQLPSEMPSPEINEDACTLRLSGLIFEEFDDEELDIDSNLDYSSGDVTLFEENNVVSEFASVLNGTGMPEVLNGTSSGRCVALQDLDLDDNVYCIFSFRFPNGTISMAGVFSNTIVIAGSGCYAGISGYLEISEIEAPQIGDLEDSYSYTFREMTSDTESCTPDVLSITSFTQNFGPTYIDWPPTFSSPGDVFVFDTDTITSSGAILGSAEGECMFHLDVSSRNKLYCTITFILGPQNDRLLVEGLMERMTIVGGTGCFYGVTGTVSGNFGSSLTTINYNLALDDPANLGVSCPPGLFDNAWTEPYGDQYVDYGQMPGSAYVFDNKLVTITLPNFQSITGRAAGRCHVLEGEGGDLYCLYTMVFPSLGSITFVGFYDFMIITGGSGCFRNLSGNIIGDEDDVTQRFTYTFQLD